MKQLYEAVEKLRAEADRLQALADGPAIGRAPADIGIREAVKRLMLAGATQWDLVTTLTATRDGKYSLRFHLTLPGSNYQFGDSLAEVVEKCEAATKERPPAAEGKDAVDRVEQIAADLAGPAF